MEREEKPLPIENRTFGEYATKFHAYAKALHYKELKFFTETSPAIIEAIEINSKLQRYDAAWGTLLVARPLPRAVPPHHVFLDILLPQSQTHHCRP